MNLPADTGVLALLVNSTSAPSAMSRPGRIGGGRRIDQVAGDRRALRTRDWPSLAAACLSARAVLGISGSVSNSVMVVPPP